jgi:hypothetical protein
LSALRNRRELDVHIIHHEVPVTVVEYHVDGGRLSDASQYVRPVTSHAYEPDFPQVLQFVQSRNGLVNDLLHRSKLYVVGLENIDVVSTEPAKRCFEPLDDRASREVKIVEALPTAFRSQHNFVSAVMKRRAFRDRPVGRYRTALSSHG